MSTNLSPSYFEDANWLNALTLAERGVSFAALASEIVSANGNRARAERRLERWRTQTPFTTSSYFAQRLAGDQLTEEKLLLLLGEPIESVLSRYPKPPDWLAELELAFKKFASESGNSDALQLAEQQPKMEALKFLAIIWPLICCGRERLEAGILSLEQQYPELPFDAARIKDMLQAHLLPQLAMKLSRTLVLELNVARLNGQLQGETSEDRFKNFLELLHDPQVAIPILNEYPVLARQLVTTINYWAHYSVEFLEHLCADQEALRDMSAAGDQLGQLLGVEA